ncbi:hypothetical protein FIBSPDRAFT_877585 [Athelia psychrophila]|uniref:Zn(2)-C6 fungal-type domain-containing protein n=1 Tax=Athelia psychrophila TaxID=1759441 RepID=A0A167VUG1_9AGAM|nr:hypothetical protein FIBSPDRAFT_877585 [Fibularhizoctonia sp. CBS 109695]
MAPPPLRQAESGPIPEETLLFRRICVLTGGAQETDARETNTTAIKIAGLPGLFKTSTKTVTACDRCSKMHLGCKEIVEALGCQRCRAKGLQCYFSWPSLTILEHISARTILNSSIEIHAFGGRLHVTTRRTRVLVPLVDVRPF